MIPVENMWVAVTDLTEFINYNGSLDSIDYWYEKVVAIDYDKHALVVISHIGEINVINEEDFQIYTDNIAIPNSEHPPLTYIKIIYSNTAPVDFDRNIAARTKNLAALAKIRRKNEDENETKLRSV